MQRSAQFQWFSGRLLVTLALAAGAILILSGSVAAKPPNDKPGGGSGGENNGAAYVVVDLGSGGSARAVEVNNLGGIILSHQGPDEIWELDATGAVQRGTQLPGLDTQDSFAADINDAFEVAGSADIVDGDGSLVSRGVVWRLNSAGNLEMIELPPLPVAPGNRSHNYAKGISSDGVIAGYAIEQDGKTGEWLTSTPVVWAVDGSNQVFGFALPGGGEAWDVNSSGVVVGRLGNGSGVLWLLDFDELGNLISSPPIPLPGLAGGSALTPVEVTDGGRIAGDASTSDGDRHAVVWTLDMQLGEITVTDLGKPADMDFAQAIGANDKGQVAGYAAGVRRKGVNVINEWTAIFGENGSLVDLNAIVIDYGGLKELELALGINDLGWICGSGVSRTTSRAFVAIPLP